MYKTFISWFLISFFCITCFYTTSFSQVIENKTPKSQDSNNYVGEKVHNPNSTATSLDKNKFAVKDSGIVSHQWYSKHGASIRPEELFTDEGTRQYYLNTYGFEIFQEFPDYPRWEVKNPDPNQVLQYKLRVAEWSDKNKRFTEFMEKRKKELENNSNNENH
ncbi:MAG: hypothetical protein RMJ53_06435 [Chitinophagales bacterium]|nr:hypothetical protein [Chitinophagales bacterium]MDW8273847.1 hypothetical protein [Chitinophagales bacterium]